MKTSVVFLLLALSALVAADLYMHNPRGSNNRLDEQNRNRANGNRLFDSQNNNKGGYNVGVMDYIAGSTLQLEWTNQHSCGAENADCELVFQVMCEAGATGAGIRNGAVTNRITTGDSDDPQYGRHETGAYYDECTTRERNKGLFIADQNLNGNTAKYSRQNTNGNRHGLECPEERDYYPYWHPTPFADVAIITTNVARCPYYQTESQNVADKGHCTGTLEGAGDGRKYNNQGACEGNGFSWVQDSAFDLEAPECVAAGYARDNHLGNGVNAEANSFDWIVPDAGEQTSCVLRMRYNVSTKDFDGWNIDASKNGADKSPVTQNPVVDVGEGVELKLALNTDQLFRTFQDRSSIFTVSQRPDGIDSDASIVNINVVGQRGNIVQNYPAVEYDFKPKYVTVNSNGYVVRQITGSNTTPAGAGQGRENTDRSNFVQITDPANNYPTYLKDIKMFTGECDVSTDECFATVKAYAMQGQNDNELDDASPNQLYPPMQYTEPGSFHYMNSRTNNFSNRSQKGYVMAVEEDSGLSSGAIAAIVVGAVGVVAVPTGAATYAAARPNSKLGQAARNGIARVTGSGGAPSINMPNGYAIGK